MAAVHEPSLTHPVVRDSRLRPRQGSPVVPTLGIDPGATGRQTSEQEATLVAHIYIANMVKIAHPCTVVKGPNSWNIRSLVGREHSSAPEHN